VDELLDIDQFRSIILRYAEHRITHPFMSWFRQRDVAGAFSSAVEKVLVVLINSRFDQQTRAEHALENTNRVYTAGALKRVVDRDEVPLLIPRRRMTTERWTDLFSTSQRRLRRLAKRIEAQQRWSASSLLACMRSQNYNVPYLRLKPSRLAVRWLHELVPELDIDMSDFEITLDARVYRVASRLGIVDPKIDMYVGVGSPADRNIQAFARVLFPDDPWMLDEPLWHTGRRLSEGGQCSPTTPHCRGCIFEDVCPKRYVDANPSEMRIGLPAGTCPICGSPLVWRIARRTDELYRGCTNFRRGCRWQDRS
jgi:hypothetical protein